ncbi:hypothetical protein AC578_9706 [Pseudocercospora eumusae]|uniref:BTB domain-containing protein n=1 Tax=Pseudocercospora eumusae TaxID=321146 RepID=A0A139HQK6_9PEZI|nr:hypothetical protein AC578_9706 [Pseudocercospora eumusae]
MADTDQLARLMQSLPQEIFDKIYQITFELPRFTGLKEAHDIPFTFLHVDYSSREDVAARFYSTASIIHYGGTPNTYLNFIPRHHRFLIREVFCAWNSFNCTKYEMEHRSMNPAYLPHGAISAGESQRAPAADVASTSFNGTNRVRSSYSTVLTIHVGENEEAQSFIVHKDLAAQSSPYIKAATAPDRWIEGKENVISMPEQRPRAFQTYLEWLYNPEVDLGAAIRELAKDETTGIVEIMANCVFTNRLIECWVLGDYIGDVKFKNAVMRTMFKGGIGWSPRTLHCVFEKTSQESVLQQWVIEAIYEILSDKETPKATKDKAIKALPEHSAKILLERFVKQVDEPTGNISERHAAFLEKEE